jgi:hypothetical protein
MRLKRDSDFTAAFPAAQGAEVEVSLSTGARISRRVSDVVAATESEIRARFRAAAGELIGMERADAVEEMIDSLERFDRAGRIVELCAPAGRKGRSRTVASRARTGP